jgi:hypothetical protein
MEEEVQEQKKGFFSRIKSFFHKGTAEEDQMYKRKMMDKKVERYLDNNFESFITEYGMVREIDLVRYDERHGILTQKLAVLNEFVKDADAEIGGLEIRVDHLKKNIKGYKG